MTLSVARAVENFLYQCESCVTNSDESLRDNIVMRLESIITNLEKFMHIADWQQLSPTKRDWNIGNSRIAVAR